MPWRRQSARAVRKAVRFSQGSVFGQKGGLAIVQDGGFRGGMRRTVEFHATGGHCHPALGRIILHVVRPLVRLRGESAMTLCGFLGGSCSSILSWARYHSRSLP